MSYTTASSVIGEQLFISFNLSWWIQGSAILFHTLLFLVLLIPLGSLAFAVFVFTAWDLIDRYFTEYSVTNRRVVYRRGIIRRVTREVDIGGIESVDLNQSILGRVLGYGSIRVRGRGGISVDFFRVGGVVAVRRAIQESIDKR